MIICLQLLERERLRAMVPASGSTIAEAPGKAALIGTPLSYVTDRKPPARKSSLDVSTTTRSAHFALLPKTNFCIRLIAESSW